MRLLIVTSVEAEAGAIGPVPAGMNGRTIVAGIGRTNAAAATTEAIIRDGPFDAVLSCGVAGALPADPPAAAVAIGETIVASECLYYEEGLVSPSGFSDMAAMGFPLGDFEGNRVPVDQAIMETLAAKFMLGPIATVATCSGTDEAARAVAARTGAVAEAMEGAAVVHAARRLGHPAIEIRTISNTTGDRHRQKWDLAGALDALGTATRAAIELLGSDAAKPRRKADS